MTVRPTSFLSFSFHFIFPFFLPSHFLYSIPYFLSTNPNQKTINFSVQTLPPPTNNTVTTAKSFSRCIQWCLPRVITPPGFCPHVLSGPLMPSSLFLAKSSLEVPPCPFGMVLYHRSSTRIKLSIGSHPTVWPQ